MIRVSCVRFGHHRLAGCATHAAALRRRRRRSRRPRRRRPNRRRRPSRNMAPSASTPPAWTRASRPATISIVTPTAPGRRTRRSRRQVELRHVHRPRRSVARADPRRSSRTGQGPEQPDRRRLCELHGRGGDRGEGPDPVRAVARPRSAALKSKAGLAELDARGRPHRHRQPVRRRSSARTTRRPTNMH